MAEKPFRAETQAERKTNITQAEDANPHLSILNPSQRLGDQTLSPSTPSVIPFSVYIKQ